MKRSAWPKSWKGMSEREIIAARHAEYSDEDKPHVRRAFALLGMKAA